MTHTTYVCVPCREVSKHPSFDKKWRAACRKCSGELREFYKWSAPKKNNDRAWKRIERGEIYWNRRKSRRWSHITSPIEGRRNIINKPKKDKRNSWGWMLEYSGSRGPDTDLGG